MSAVYRLHTITGHLKYLSSIKNFKMSSCANNREQPWCSGYLNCTISSDKSWTHRLCAGSNPARRIRDCNGENLFRKNNSFNSFQPKNNVQAKQFFILFLNGQGIQEWTKQNLWKATFKNLKGYGLLKAVFHKFYLVQSWKLCLKYGL